MNTKKCLRELFTIAEREPALAKKIYESLPKGFYKIQDIRQYFTRGNQNSASLSMEIALENFENSLLLEDYLCFLSSNDPIINLKANTSFMNVSGEVFFFGKLIKVLSNMTCRPAHDSVRRLLLEKYPNKIGREMLINFHLSSDESIRKQSSEILLERKEAKWMWASLLNYSSNDDEHVADIARTLLLMQFRKKLTMKNLLDFQMSKDTYVKSTSKMLLLSLPAKQLNYTILLDHTRPKCVETKSLASKLIIINFDRYMTGKDFFNTQRSKSPEIRLLGFNLALKQRKEKFTLKLLDLNRRSPDKNVRHLACTLIATFYPTADIMDEISSFMSRHAFHAA